MQKLPWASLLMFLDINMGCYYDTNDLFFSSGSRVLGKVECQRIRLGMCLCKVKMVHLRHIQWRSGTTSNSSNVTSPSVQRRQRRSLKGEVVFT